MIRVENTGGDWVHLSNFEFSGLAPQARATAFGESDWLLIRLTAAPGVETPPTVSLAALSGADGTYDMETVDLDSGLAKTSAIDLKQFAILDLKMVSKDEVLILKRR
jgi:hypothetical protein